VACANVMFFAQEVVDEIGTFDTRYVHSGCDYDYSRMATFAGIPVLTTYSFVGECENEHRKNHETEVNTAAMTFSQRKKYLYKPTTGRTDYLLYMKKFQPKHYYISKTAFLLELYMPHVYRFLFKKRKGELSKKHMENAQD
jgi:GT2 family glycosyltransferase